jgi:hypothetical protein
MYPTSMPWASAREWWVIISMTCRSARHATAPADRVKCSDSMISTVTAGVQSSIYANIFI